MKNVIEEFLTDRILTVVCDKCCRSESFDGSLVKSITKLEQAQKTDPWFLDENGFAICQYCGN